MAGEPATQPLVVADALGKTYPGRHGHEATAAVVGASFAIVPGETLGLVGESGSGKSTIGQMVVGLQRPTAGSLRVARFDMTTISRRELREVRRNAQMVFQDPVASLNRRHDVAAAVSGPLDVYRVGSRRERREHVRELVALVGLDDRYLDRYPRELSGGQCQRVGVARALALEPNLLVLDEAVTALDLSTRSEILNLLRDLQQRLALTYLFISHDLAVVRYMADTICVMQNGRIVESGGRDVLFRAPEDAYTRELIGAIVEPPRPAELAGR